MATVGRKRMGGMMLLEMLLALALLALVSAFALPAMSEWRRDAAIKSSSSHFLAALNAGRYLALAENHHVTLCPLDSRQQCGDQWERSIQMFVDINHNGRLDAADRQLHREILFPENTWLEWHAFRELPYLQWAPLGQTASLNGTFTLCNREGRAERWRQWVVSRVGRVRMVTPALVGGVVLQRSREVCG